MSSESNRNVSLVCMRYTSWIDVRLEWIRVKAGARRCAEQVDRDAAFEPGADIFAERQALAASITRSHETKRWR